MKVLVFYDGKLHSEYEGTAGYWEAMENGVVPDNSFRYLPEYNEWLHAGKRRTVHEENVPPLYRAMALLLVS